MALQILIGGVDYTQYVDLKSVKVSQSIAVNSDTAECLLTIPQQVAPRPKGGQEIKFINGSTIEFGGVVLQAEEDALTPDTMQYDVQCRDYVYIFNKRVVTNTYTGWTYDAIVRDIVKNFTTGFTANNVKATGTTISQIKFDHKMPGDALKSLADQIAWQWWIDYSKDVHFGSPGSIPSPLPNNTLLPDTDTVNYGDLKVTDDVSQVRNQIYLLGFKVPATYSITQNFVADGQTDTFYTGYEPKHDLKSITVAVGGTKQTNALDIAGGLPNNQMVDGKVYVGYSNQSYRFNQAPAQNSVVSITYVPMFETVKMYNDPTAMAAMQQRDGIDGVYEFAIRDRQLTNIDFSVADLRGSYELAKYAYPHYSGGFVSFTQGWRTGQFFYLTSNKRMDGIFQNKKFYVVKVKKTIVNHPLNGSPTFKSDVTISDSPYVY